MGENTLRCPYCNGMGYTEEPRYEQATREMAMDAGNLDLEGQAIYAGEEQIGCLYCDCHGEIDRSEVVKRTLLGDQVARQMLNDNSEN